MTLDEDVEQLLREAMHNSRRSFKETLNAAIRAGLSTKPLRSRRASLNKLADDLEVEAIIKKMGRKKRT